MTSALLKHEIQLGVNNHNEYSWSDITQEKILQLSYQMVRVNDKSKREEIAKIFYECFKNANKEEKKTLIKLLAYTRDIEEGKGEYAICLTIIAELFKYEREVCISIMKYFVGFNTLNTAFGSWKDMKYLFNELGECPIELLTIINNQVRSEIIKKKINPSLSLSLVAKWIPREKSKKFGWIFEKLAKNYYQQYGLNGWNSRAILKAKTNYRKLISKFNKELDTLEIKQCNKRWGSININNITSISLIKQKKALLYINKNEYDDNDRCKCRMNMMKYIEDVENEKCKIKGKNIELGFLIKNAIDILNSNSYYESERKLLIELWKSNSKNTKYLENILPIIDISDSMDSENKQALYNAIGLGIRIAEKSRLGKRLIAFNNKPYWINMEDSKDYMDMVKKIKNIPWGLNADFYRAIDMIIDTIIENNIPADDIENLTLVILSDMQFDEVSKEEEKNLSIKQILNKKFEEVGVSISGIPYKCPHLLFWNMKRSNGFPEISYENNTTMLSGYSPVIINMFIEEGINNIRHITPWIMLNKILTKERYKNIEEIIN